MLPDNYELIQLGTEHSAVLSEFLMSHFLLEEPLNRATNMSRESFKPFVEKLLERTLNIPFSYAVIEKSSTKIVACAMSSIWKNENSEEDSDEFTFNGKKNEGINSIGRILTELHGRFFKIRPELKTVLHLEILSVAKDHQRRGLASILMNKMEEPEKIKNFNSSAIASEISSLANQCLMEKRGYKALSEILLSSHVDNNGVQLITTDDGTEKVVLVMKEF